MESFRTETTWSVFNNWLSFFIFAGLKCPSGALLRSVTSVIWEDTAPRGIILSKLKPCSKQFTRDIMSDCLIQKLLCSSRPDDIWVLILAGLCVLLFITVSLKQSSNESTQYWWIYLKLDQSDDLFVPSACLLLMRRWCYIWWSTTKYLLTMSSVLINKNRIISHQR